MADLTLYGDASWQSPWVFHVMVALDELELPYQLVPLKFPIGDELKTEMRSHALLGLTPCLVHGDVWLTESIAISEYLAEAFPPPQHARILPSDLLERARARQIMSWLRTRLFALRDARPTSSVFLRPISTPLTDKARDDADELIRVADQAIPQGRASLAATWSIADADLALALSRLIANDDHVPQRLVDYAMATWGRRSVRKYLAYIPTTR